MSKKTFIVIAVVAFIGLISFDTLNKTINIPMVPEIKINGNAIPSLYPDTLVSSDVMRNILKNRFIGASSIILADTQYQRPKHDSMVELIEWVSDFYWNTPSLKYRPEAYDCDNFARTFTVFSDLAAAGKFDGQLAIFRLYVNQLMEWANIPAGGKHAIILFYSDKGLFVYEPQNGTIENIVNYPNTFFVFSILGD